MFLTISFPNFARKLEINQTRLKISIIIAFKNELKNLDDLFSSLAKLDYPLDNYEIILVDDDSTDDSYKKAVKLSEGKNNYHIIKVEDKKFPAKKGTLDIGIRRSKFPYILITDADCLPSKNWLNEYSEKFKDDYDFLLGAAPFRQTQNIINKISCFENLRSSLLIFSLANLKLPYSATARNLGFRKSAFEEMGGFNNIQETLSGDDDLLLREAVKHKMKIGIVDWENSFVLSNSKTTLREYISQRARHTTTSLYYLPTHKFLLGFWHSSNILTLVSILFAVINSYFVIPLLIKLLIDSSVVLISQKKLNYKFKLSEIPFLQLLYEFFLIVNFFSSFRKNIHWKNDRPHSNYLNTK